MDDKKGFTPEARRRIRNAYGMLKQALLDDIEENRDGGQIALSKDLSEEVVDDLWYTLEVFRHDILPAAEIKTDKSGQITNDDDI
jgi:hypothetical protein